MTNGLLSVIIANVLDNSFQISTDYGDVKHAERRWARNSKLRRVYNMTIFPKRKDIWEIEAQIDAANRHIEIALKLLRKYLGDTRSLKTKIAVGKEPKKNQLKLVIEK